MINKKYRLIAPKQIDTDFCDEKFDSDKVIVRPIYLSICAADQRYYQGTRSQEALKKKLPMSLIHEGVGEVIYDPRGEFEKGDHVVMIPNKPLVKDEVIKENYLRNSHFRGSGYDGFMQEFVNIRRNRIITYKNIEDKVAVLLELISVSMNAMEHFNNYSHIKKQTIGVWGNGNVGFITALVIKKLFPNSKVVVLGPSTPKMEYFTFVDEVISIDKIPADFSIDHAFECVGGYNSEEAIDQIIDYINPEGSISLMGVSEQNVAINTRMVLEKGLTLLGNSRSSYDDFKAAIEFLNNYPDVSNYLKTIISDEVVIKNISDIDKAFSLDTANQFKTVMKWDI